MYGGKECFSWIWWVDTLCPYSNLFYWVILNLKHLANDLILFCFSCFVSCLVSRSRGMSQVFFFKKNFCSQSFHHNSRSFAFFPVFTKGTSPARGVLGPCQSDWTSSVLRRRQTCCWDNVLRIRQAGILLTIYTLTSVCIFSILFSVHFRRGWQGEFVSQSRAALVGDHLLYSHGFHVWFRADIVRRNYILVSVRG